MQQFGHQRLTWSRGEEELAVLDLEFVIVFTCVVMPVLTGKPLLIAEDLLELLLHCIL